MPYRGHIQVMCPIENDRTEVIREIFPSNHVSLSDWGMMVVDKGEPRISLSHTVTGGSIPVISWPIYFVF